MTTVTGERQPMQRSGRKRAIARSPFLLLDPRDATREIDLPMGVVVVGSSAACDVVIDGSRVHPRHATMVVDEGKVVVHGAGGGGEVRVNDTQVKSAVLREGDVVAFGDAELHVRRRNPRAAATTAPASAPRPQPPVSEPVLELLNELYQWTHVGSADRHGALLGVVVDRLGLQGAALLTASLEAPVALLHAWGEVIGGLMQGWVAEALTEGARETSWMVRRRQSDVLAALPTAGGGALGLFVRGLGENCPDGALTLILRFFARELRTQSPLLVDEPRDTGLVFPEGVLVGRATAMAPVYEALRSALGSSIPVHFHGEGGVGRRTLARVLDASAATKAGGSRYHPVEAGAQTFDTELAALHRDLARRRGGSAPSTVFFSEVDRLDLRRQAGLVALLDSVGESGERGERAAEAAPRIVSSSTRELQRLVERGRFRRDLWLRLTGADVRVPALRERREDVPLFFDHFLAEEMGVASPPIGVPALDALVSHTWPGNLWELRREAQRVALRVRGSVVELDHLSLRGPRDPAS